MVGLGYDVQGNLANKNGQRYTFDYGNRLRDVTGKESYRYDGLGRRALASSSKLSNIVSVYTKDGQLWYQNDQRRRANLNYIYLGGSLVATREVVGSAQTVKYQHTDALGTPIAVTGANKALVQTSEYEPYGQLLNRTLTDGPGFTGHVQDALTGLTYMQQRYYDQGIGRFLSTDPVTAYAKPGVNFNRYWYANDNPYRFSDPDGREAACVALNTGCGISSENFSNNMSAIGDALEAVDEVFTALGPAGGLEHLAVTPLIGLARGLAAETKAATALERAGQISGAMSKVTQSKVTIAVAETAEGTRVVGSSEGALRTAARAALQPGEIAAKGAKGVHAEVNAVNGAKKLGLTPTSVAPSRPACGGCQAAMREAGVKVEGPVKRVEN